MMRLSTVAWYGTQTGNMARLQANAGTLQTDIATGRRLRMPSDDPVASARADRLARVESQARSWQANGDTAARRLETSSTALIDMSDQVARMRELALAAANDTMTPTDRQTIAVEVRELTEGLLSLANTQGPDGRHVFAGAASGAPAYARVDGAIAWQGDGNAARVPIGEGRTIAVGDRGDETFAAADGTSLFQIAEALGAALEATPADQVETDDARVARRAALDTALTRLDQAADRIGEVAAAQGARLSQIDATNTRHDTDILEAIAARSALEDTDITRAIVDLERTLTLLQAAQAGFTRISGLSLFQRL
ncbi:MAG: flagellar hook-associated protein FlgL [Pseudomonadota bacterium]